MLALVFVVAALVCFLLGGVGVALPRGSFDQLGKAALVAAVLAGWHL